MKNGIKLILEKLKLMLDWMNGLMLQLLIGMLGKRIMEKRENLVENFIFNKF